MKKNSIVNALLFMFFVLASINVKAQLVTIGTGTTTNTVNPINSCFGYSYTQQIYTAAEIIAANGGTAPNGQIINLKFHLSTSSFNSGSANSNLWTVYLGNTAQAVYTAAATSYIPVASMTQVFSGVVTFPAFGNWMNIALTVPFTWDGTSNIVVAIDENQPSWDCTMYWTSTSTSPSNRCIYYYNDSNNPNPASPPTPTSVAAVRPNVQLQWAQPCNVVTGLPTTGTVAASPTSICGSGNVTLNFTPGTAMPSTTGITYKWQSSPTAAGTYTDIPGAVTTVPTYTTTVPITATTYFKCVVLCNATSTPTTILTSSASNVVTLANPGNATGTGASRCGPGTLSLSATSSVSGTNLNWYTTATGGSAIGTGSPWTTPFNPVTTTYYVASEINSPATGTIGTGTLTNTTTTYPTPFGQWFTASHDQYLIRASEMIAAGFSAGTITSMAFNLASGYPATSAALQQFKIMMGNATQTTMPAALITTPTGGFTTVVPAATFTPPAVAGPVNYTFATPFIWDGVSSIVIDVSFSNAGTGCVTSFTNNGVVTQSSTSFVSTISYIGDGNCTINTMAPNVTGTNYSQRPNITLTGTGTCANARVPVLATITPSPATTLTYPSVVCNGLIKPMSIASSPMSNYTNYTWTPNVTDLYTNAAATTPYISGSAPNVYFKSTTVGPRTFYVFSSGATAAACTHADTFSVWVQPDSVKIIGTPDTICVSGTTTLSLFPTSGYAANSIQWQQSTDGTTYTNITGATSATYTTPTLTTPNYYKALIKSTNDTCQHPVKYVVIANPVLLGVIDSFNCGPGTVTLGAITGGNGSAIWYDVPTGGAPVGYGNPFTTPAISSTTNFYVSTAGGTILGTKVLGAGALTSGVQEYNPFAAYWGGTKIQYLVRASELIAAGIPAGSSITNLGMNVVTGGTNYPGFAISMKNTTSTVVTATYEAGTATVFDSGTPGVTPVSNALNNYNFTTPFAWDGTSNVLIQMCWSNLGSTATGNTVRGDATTFVATHRGQSDVQTPAGMCGTAGASTNSTYSNRPKFTFGYRARCETPRQVVHANIYPKPAVDLGADINACVDAGSAIVLDAGYQPNTPVFLWDNGSTSQVRAVNTSGTYNVKVTNQYTCVGRDTINVILRKNPVVHLGNDTTVCNGVTLPLYSGSDGIQYFWNTGETSANIDVNSAGYYSVFVTNAEGCVATDTIQVLMQGELPTINGIQVSNDGDRTFHFTAVYPQNVIGYDWDFGDGSQHSYEVAPYHTYDSVGDFVVVLHLSSTCGFGDDTATAHIVGINQITVNNDELTVYPNPSNAQATIWNKGSLKMEKIEVYSMLGQVVYRSKADSKDKHVINLDKLASGVYTIEVYTDKGTVARKLEIIK